jgi:hypothetical protein
MSIADTPTAAGTRAAIRVGKQEQFIAGGIGRLAVKQSKGWRQDGGSELSIYPYANLRHLGDGLVGLFPREGAQRLRMEVAKRPQGVKHRADSDIVRRL